MEVSVTHFKNIYDNVTDNVTQFENFEKFERALYGISEVERTNKLSATLISPAVYQQGTTRSNANVVKWSGWCAVDVDDYTPEGDLENDLLSSFSHYYFVCYSTASSTASQPKFRLVFPLTSEVERDRIPGFWHALNNELGALADRQTKDLSRMYYVPGRYHNSFSFIFSNRNGSYVDPDLLIKKHPIIETKGKSFFDRLPASIQDQIVEHRKSKAQNDNVTWTGYADCPFVNRSLVNEYMTINSTGWYHTMYRLMVSIAANAIRDEYPITPHEIANLCKDLDAATGNWYDNRPLEKEAERAIEFVYRSV
tara:strand:+ start:4938 stop:5867 length:930 start_codon:yes stop_codon:yes gene_type:complete